MIGKVCINIIRALVSILKNDLLCLDGLHEDHIELFDKVEILRL